MDAYIDIFSSEEEAQEQAAKEQAWEDFTDDFSERLSDDNGSYNPVLLTLQT